MNDNVKIWLIADTHFGLKSDDQDWLNDYAGYFENTVIPMMKERVGKNDILVHCGDVFDNRTIIGLNTISRVVSLFEKFSEVFNDIRIVIGNHDMYKKSSNDVTSVDVLKHIPNVKIYSEPTVEVISGKTCLFNPWIEDVEKQVEVLKGVDVNYIFGHLQIGGSKSIDRKGKCVEMKGGVKKSDFKSAQVYAGHIHIRQDMKNVHYVGNPYHKDKSDIDNIKGITVLDIKTGETEFIENTVSPKFISENIFDIFETTIGELKIRWKNNRVELHLKGEDSIRCNFDEFRSCLNDYYRSFETTCDNEVKMEIGQQDVDTDLSHAKSNSDQMDDYIKYSDVSPEVAQRVKNRISSYIERI